MFLGPSTRSVLDRRGKISASVTPNLSRGLNVFNFTPGPIDQCLLSTGTGPGELERVSLSRVGTSTTFLETLGTTPRCGISGFTGRHLMLK